MACCTSAKSKKQHRINMEINHQLREDHRRRVREEQFILLGLSGSGKSTFIKQAKKMRNNDYSDEYRKGFVSAIHQSLIIAIQSLFVAVDALAAELYCPISEEIKDKAKAIQAMDSSSVTLLEEPYTSYIKDICADVGIQMVIYERRSEYDLSDSVAYFLNNIDRIVEPDYLPTDQDILRVNLQPQLSVTECLSEVDSNTFRLVDVGSQTSSRRKWIAQFEGFSAILFFVALSEYDQVIVRNNRVENRLKESMVLFEEICNYSCLNDLRLVLLFNKEDLFKEKIMNNSHLVDYFPEFHGPPWDPTSARDFICDAFMDLNTDPDRIIYRHFTCFTDIENTMFILSSVVDTVWASRCRYDLL